jgi:diguanylate cyclase (GGDEF)-like protein/PAS domain S-box-containing protein
MSSLITLALTASQLYHEYHSDVARIEKRLDDIRVTQSAAISDQLWELNDDILEQTLTGLAKLPEIDYLQVRGTDGLVRTAGRRTAEDTLTRQFILRYPTPQGEIRIGTLDVVASLAPAREQLVTRLGSALAGNAIKTFIVSGFALALIHLLVIRRINGLGALCRKWSPGHGRRPSVPAREVARPDEIDEMGTALVEMLHGIESSYADLLASEARYRQLIETAEEGICLLDEQGHTTFVNPRLARLLDDSPDAITGRSALDFIEPRWHAPALETLERCRRGAIEQHEVALRRKDGTWCWTLVTTSPGVSESGDYRGALAMITDIDQRKRAEARAAELAWFDTLTRLPNRAFMLDRLSGALERARHQGRFGALLFLDLDNFKTINDSSGHQVGDAVLTRVAATLRTAVREKDSVSRFGGDEFVVLLPDVHRERESAAAACSAVARKLIDAVASPIHVEGRDFRISASMGINLFDGHESAEAVLQNADAALYRSKSEGRGGMTFYREEMRELALRRLELEKGLRDAVANGTIETVYQPIVDTDKGQAIGFEALSRWNHPEHGVVPPDVFIPIAEDMGIIQRIGQQCLERACTELAPLLRDRHGGITHGVSVNLSPTELVDPGLVDRVRQALQASDIPPDRLHFEITEGSMIHETEAAIDNMNAVRSLGPAFAVDDFGTGYSSLKYLKSLPLRTLKIDRAFIHDLTEDPDDDAIVNTILTIAEHFGLQVIAEGIESEKHLEALRRKGLHAGQGYWFARPMPGAALYEWLGSPDAPQPHH